MVYEPIAAMLFELFPTRIRYTSVCSPYHIGNGWFGGFHAGPTAFAYGRRDGNIYSGLWYPVVVAGRGPLVIGLFLLPELIRRESMHKVFRASRRSASRVIVDRRRRFGRTRHTPRAEEMTGAWASSQQSPSLKTRWRRRISPMRQGQSCI